MIVVSLRVQCLYLNCTVLQTLSFLMLEVGKAVQNQ